MATDSATDGSDKIRKKYFCDQCHYTTSDIRDFNKHATTRKHKQNESATDKSVKTRKKYYCGPCDYTTSDINDFNKHETTRKHIRVTCKTVTSDKSEKIQNQFSNSPLNEQDLSGNDKKNYTCNNCNKLYINRTGLWRHKKKCSPLSDSNDENNHEGITYSILENTHEDTPQNTPLPTFTMDMFMEIMKQNKEVQMLLIEQNNKFMEKMAELAAIPKNTISNSNNTNNNNFNLNVFLNEHCKDAINMDDFINSLEVTVEDLVKTGKLGYVDGITRIFINGLKELDISKRPIHCTDLKRESVYVRYDDKWEKESDDKPRLHRAIQRIAVKNIKQLRNWEIENPDFTIIDTKASDDYFQITKHCMGGIGDDDRKFKDKVIRNIINTVKIP
jgi:hypothetical protein